jgi:hypothetical protein
MLSNGDETTYEVCFTVSPDKRTNQITYVKPDHLFNGNTAEDVVLKVKANSEADAEEKGYQMLSDPAGQFVKKYGPGFEMKTKYIWRVIY